MPNRRDWLRSCAWWAGAAGGALPFSSPAQAQAVDGFDKAQSSQWRGQLNEVLRGNILKFWLDKSLDREHGGYYMHFDAQGNRKAENTKAIVTQARTLWLFSRAASNDYEGEGIPPRETLLAAARHGYEGLRDNLWDHEHGGFYWTADPVAGKVTMPGKHLYGQMLCPLRTGGILSRQPAERGASPCRPIGASS